MPLETDHKELECGVLSHLHHRVNTIQMALELIFGGGYSYFQNHNSSTKNSKRNGKKKEKNSVSPSVFLALSSHSPLLGVGGGESRGRAGEGSQEWGK